MAAGSDTDRRPPAMAALLERDVELGALSELVHVARGGLGGLMLVEGPPGVGKSALLEHAAGMGRAAGLLVLRARGHELERAFGWGVARSLLEARSPPPPRRSAPSC